MASCARCGTFLCGACTELQDEAAYCASCLVVMQKGAVRPRVVVGIVVLNALALLALPLLRVPPLLNLTVAVFGLWLGTRELRRIRESGGAARGRGLARLALGLGAVNGLVTLAWIGLLAYSVLRFGRP